VTLLAVCFWLVGIVFLINAIDDLLIDIAQLANGLRPIEMTTEGWGQVNSADEKSIGIMVPAWKESDVLESMVRLNLSRLKYGNYRWFIGVYPNDIDTVTIAEYLEAKYPEQIYVIKTDRIGPTTKAHCLNCILRFIEDEKYGRLKGWFPHYLVIHDAEDVIHPKSLKLVNAQETDTDFIQLPIFSLPVDTRQWVAGTYLDEFSEVHLKELPVRQMFKMPIPSAGVGTFFSWRILDVLHKRFGYWFDPENVTEDYEISLRIARIGGKQKFLLNRDEGGEIIATREYFPEHMGRSIRQKSRWSTGIGLQTMARWGAFGIFRSKPSFENLATAYALWRDRKAIWTNPATLFAWGLVCVWMIVAPLGLNRDMNALYSPGVIGLFVANMMLLTIRLIQRARFCMQLYGVKHGVLAMPRLLASTAINGSASLLALKSYLQFMASRGEKKIEWEKTEHKFPELTEIFEGKV